MLMKTRHATWIGHLLLVVFLLSSVSISNASFWCQDAESSAHLVSSPGTCQVISPVTKDQQLCCEEIDRTGEFLSIPSVGCFDFPVFSSVSPSTNRSTSPSRIAVPPLEMEETPSTLGINSQIAPFADRSLAFQLPSRQALTSLQTIILLR